MSIIYIQIHNEQQIEFRLFFYFFLFLINILRKYFIHLFSIFEIHIEQRIEFRLFIFTKKF